MRNVEGVRLIRKPEKHLALSSKNRMQSDKQQYEYYLSGELRSWVNCSCALPRSALRATSAPRRTERGHGPPAP